MAATGGPASILTQVQQVGPPQVGGLGGMWDFSFLFFSWEDVDVDVVEERGGGVRGCVFWGCGWLMRCFGRGGCG